MLSSLEMKPLRVPALHFALPKDFALAGIEELRGHTRQLRKRYAEGVGSPEKLSADIEAIGCVVHQRHNPEEFIIHPRHVRLLFLAYLKYRNLPRLCPFTEAFAGACRKAARRLSRLALNLLARLFFGRFDDVIKYPILLRFFKERLGEAFAQRRLPSHLAALYSHCDTVISVTGPKNLATVALRRNVPLEAVLRQTGVLDIAANEFSDTCRQIYYLDTLRSLSPGDTHAVLDELLREVARDLQNPADLTQRLPLRLQGQDRLADLIGDAIPTLARCQSGYFSLFINMLKPRLPPTTYTERYETIRLCHFATTSAQQEMTTQFVFLRIDRYLAPKCPQQHQN